MNVKVREIDGCPMVDAQWVYDLLQGQQKYFAHRDALLRSWCMAREREFIHAFEEYRSHTHQISILELEGVL